MRHRDEAHEYVCRKDTPDSVIDCSWPRTSSWLSGSGSDAVNTKAAPDSSPGAASTLINNYTLFDFLVVYILDVVVS